MSSGVKKQVAAWGQIAIGLVICSAAYGLFLIPSSVAPGGFTGIGQLVNKLWGLPVGMTALALNVPLFLLSARSLGLTFGLRSLVASIGLSFMIDFIPWPTVIPAGSGNEMMLAAVFGGVLGGVGFGLIMRGGATTGGTDMLAKLVSSKFTILSTGVIMFAIDGIVITASAVIFDIISAMFALICSFLMSTVIDLVVDGLNRARCYFIISDKGDEISERVIKEIDRGVTGLYGQGMYSGQDKKVLLCVVSRLESITLRNIVASVDSDAFMIATNVHEALGEGFAPHNKPTTRTRK